MKLHSILPAVIAMVMLVACSNDSEPNTKPSQEGEKTIVTIQLTQATQASRAAVDEIATDAEKIITSGSIYSFTEVGILETVVDFTEQDLNGVTLEMECGVGQRRFYALINTPSGVTPPRTMDPAVTIYDFEKYVHEVASIASLTDATNGFFMTNIETPELETMVAEVTNPVAIAIGRATAKLNVAYTADAMTNGEPNGTLRNVDYKLKSTPKHMYVISVYEDNVFKTPKYGVVYDAANFLISPSSETSVYTDAIDDAANCFYMTENAAPTGQLRRGPLTYVVIRGTYTPKENFVDADGNPITAPATAVTFYRKIEINSEGEFVKFADEYCYSTEPASSTYDTDIYRFEEYVDGICYYPFVIRGNGTNANDPASYDIVRNHLYKAEIIVVNGPGYWSEDATDPGPGGDLGGETEMIVTFNVVDWTPGIPQQGGI